METITPQEYDTYLDIRRRIASQGARKRWEKATPEQRKEIGKMLAEARKSKRIANADKPG